MTVAEETDWPCCPACGYLLIGLTSPHCPECGLVLPGDVEIYRPSRRRTPWSFAAPLPLWRGVWPVLRHPIKTLAACENPERVVLMRAALFAVLFAFLFLVIWGPLREFLLAVNILVRDWNDPNGIQAPFSFAWGELHDFRMRWVIPSLWLAWAFARWMLLFSVIAVLLPGEPAIRRDRMRQRLCALFLFSPWFLLLDLMCSMTVWAAAGSCVPEPNSMWPWDSGNAAAIIRFWLIRLIIPVPIVATLFFCSVLRWRWRMALIAGFLMIPVAATVWMIGDSWFPMEWLYRLILR